MKKRIRKKLHLAEFTIWGFELTTKIEPSDDPHFLDDVTNQIIAVIEKYNWLCAGAADTMFVCETFPNMGIADKIPAFLEEIKQIKGILSAEASQLQNAWY